MKHLAQLPVVMVKACRRPHICSLHQVHSIVRYKSKNRPTHVNYEAHTLYNPIKLGLFLRARVAAAFKNPTT